MNKAKPFLALASFALIGLAACSQEEVAPVTPENTPGPMAQSSALNGTYNLLRSNCGETGGDKSLVIDGNKFVYPRATCTVVSSEQQVNRTRVTLSCEGEGTGGNRVVDLQTRRDGALRLTEGSITLTYFQCMKAPASTNSLVGQSI